MNPIDGLEAALPDGGDALSGLRIVRGVAGWRLRLIRPTDCAGVAG